MGFERNTVLGMAALATAACATPQGPTFEVQQIDPHRMEQAETVFSIPRNYTVPARSRYIDIFPGSDFAIVQTAGVLNQITASEENGDQTLVIRTCSANLAEINEEATCTGRPGMAITDYGVDGSPDSLSIQTAEGTTVLTRVDREWNEDIVAQIYHGMLDRLDIHARPRV